MPPRKSGGSVASAQDDGMSVEDLNLPKTMVQRLAKGVLPANTQISKDALLAISKSATVFVNYLASHANENTQRQNKKTIQPKDVLDALKDIEFEFFESRLSQELEKYNNMQCDKRNTYRRRIKEEAKARQSGDGMNGDVTDLTSDAGPGAVVDREHAHLDPRDRPDPPGNTDDEGHVTYDEHDNKIRRKYLIRRPLRRDANGREIWPNDINPRHAMNRRSVLERKGRQHYEAGDIAFEDESEYEALNAEVPDALTGHMRDRASKRVRIGKDSETQENLHLHRAATRQRIREDWGNPNDPFANPRMINADPPTEDENEGEEGESEFESAEEEIEEDGDDTRQDLTEDPLEEQEVDENGDEDDEMLDGNESE